MNDSKVHMLGEPVDSQLKTEVSLEVHPEHRSTTPGLTSGFWYGRKGENVRK